jgi:hypothetical protein
MLLRRLAIPAPTRATGSITTGVAGSVTPALGLFTVTS